MSPQPPPDRSWITPTCPVPDYQFIGMSCPQKRCARWFLWDRSYRQHWAQEHQPPPSLPKVQPGPGPGSLSLEEEGRRLASRRDDLIALGVPSHMLAIPDAPPSVHELGEIVIERVRTVPGWELGPHCPYPEGHYQHTALCIIAEDTHHLPRKDT